MLTLLLGCIFLQEPPPFFYEGQLWESEDEQRPACGMLIPSDKSVTSLGRSHFLPTKATHVHGSFLRAEMLTEGREN